MRSSGVLNDLLEERGVEVIHPTGRPYDPGLPVEVVDTVAGSDSPQPDAIIAERVSPIVQWRGSVARQGQVSRGAESRVNLPLAKECVSHEQLHRLRN